MKRTLSHSTTKNNNNNNKKKSPELVLETASYSLENRHNIRLLKIGLPDVRLSRLSQQYSFLGCSATIDEPVMEVIEII